MPGRDAAASEAGKDSRRPFRPRARLLQLLGDQLIGSPKLAVFELVKNSYDADASLVTVGLHDLETGAPWISVNDDGEGMSPDTVANIWLVPGDDHREADRIAEKRSAIYERLPLGEKGLGRFAVHKLGDRIRMVTRAKESPECVVDVDWSELVKVRFLEDAAVRLRERIPSVFKGEATGTRIRIESLRDASWTRRSVRDLYRQLTSIVSPFKRYADSFKVVLEVPDHPDWISELPDPSQFRSKVPWFFEFAFDGSALEYTYRFNGVPGLAIGRREVTRNAPLQIPASQSPDEQGIGSRRKVVADAGTVLGIGPVRGEFYVFDRDREVLSRLGETRFMERYLDQNGGIRVYRDGIRVYNYGEPGDDWLGLDLRRVNSPTRNISRNIVLGSIDLELRASAGLREKTNREGFVENAAYARLRQVVLGAVAVLETERRVDKQRIREATGGHVRPSRDLRGPLEEIRLIASKHGLADELGPAVRKIDAEFKELRDNFLRAGLSQVGLAIVFHEVERGVAVLARMIGSGLPVGELREQAGQLQRMLETSTQLLRKGEKQAHSLKHLVRRARDLSNVRFRIHRVQLTCPALEDAAPDDTPIFAIGLALGALTNLVDNAIHWLDVAFPDDAEGAPRRRIFMDVVPDYPEGPAVVIADNGPGFSDDPQQLVEPFFSRRPEGMGLGLYYANLVMQLNDGRLIFPRPEDFDLPSGFGGAAVAMVFRRR